MNEGELDYCDKSTYKGKYMSMMWMVLNQKKKVFKTNGATWLIIIIQLYATSKSW